MNVDKLLAIRMQERALLLERIVEHLRSDRRVRAAWLSGSVSRGEDDGLSDLDLHVAVADGNVADFVKNRRQHAAELAKHLLLMDNFRNAPAGGAYLLALYEGAVGPQHVDWFWHTESRSRLPDDERILFDLVGLPVVAGDWWRRELRRPPSLPLGADPSLVDLLAHKCAFFWAMSLIVAKHIARRDAETVTRMTSLIANTLGDVARLGNVQPRSEEPWRSLMSGLQVPSATMEFHLLRTLARSAEDLGDRLADPSVVVPPTVVRQIYRFFDLTEAVATQTYRPAS